MKLTLIVHHVDVSHSSDIVALLWLTFPIEIRVVREGAKKAYLKFNKVFSLEVEPNSQEIESEELSLV